MTLAQNWPKTAISMWQSPFKLLTNFLSMYAGVHRLTYRLKSSISRLAKSWAFLKEYREDKLGPMFKKKSMRIIILYDLKGKAMDLRNCEHLRELSDSDMSGPLQKIPVLSLFGKISRHWHVRSWQVYIWWNLHVRCNSTISLPLYYRME